jgi:hypothetical protein
LGLGVVQIIAIKRYIGFLGNVLFKKKSESLQPIRAKAPQAFTPFPPKKFKKYWFLYINRNTC